MLTVFNLEMLSTLGPGLDLAIDSAKKNLAWARQKQASPDLNQTGAHVSPAAPWQRACNFGSGPLSCVNVNWLHVDR